MDRPWLGFIVSLMLGVEFVIGGLLLMYSVLALFLIGLGFLLAMLGPICYWRL